MYKHGPAPKSKKEVKSEMEDKDRIIETHLAKGEVETKPEPSIKKMDDVAFVRELLEKNLKWSQIIYEQNRKINSKLLWSAVASWLRLAVVAVPIILALIYLPPFISELQQRYVNLFSPSLGQGKSTSIDDLLNLLPLTDSQREQVKAMVK